MLAKLHSKTSDEDVDKTTLETSEDVDKTTLETSEGFNSLRLSISFVWLLLLSEALSGHIY